MIQHFIGSTNARDWRSVLKEIYFNLLHWAETAESGRGSRAGSQRQILQRAPGKQC